MIKYSTALAKLLSICAPFMWGASLLLIFLRPFISEYAFPVAGCWYVLALSIFLCVDLARRGGARLFFNPFNRAVALFIAAVELSVVVSGFARVSLFELFFLIPNILVFFVAGTLIPKERRQLITAIFLSAVIVSIYAVYQYFIGLEHTREYVARMGSAVYAAFFMKTKRAFGTFISPNIFGSYMLMMLFLSAGLTVSLSQKRKALYWLCVFIMAVALMLTKSMGGFLVYVVTFFVFVFYLLLGLKLAKPSWNALRLGLIAFLVLFLAGTGIFMRQRLPQFLASGENNSISQRYHYWEASARMAGDAWVNGIGWRRFGALYRTYKSPLANDSHYSHNVFLQMWAETGILGLAIFCWVVFLFFKTGLAILKRTAQEQMLYVGLYCAGLAFLLHNLIDLSFYFGQAAFFWWAILGLINNFATEQNPAE